MSFLFDMISVYDRKTVKPASARNAIGEMAEEFACRALHMEKLPIDGRKKLCSDALWDGKPVEIKSIGKNRRGLIYKWRIDKELEQIGREYCYIFVMHSCTIGSVSGSDLVQTMGREPPTILITSLGAVLDAIGDKPVRKFKKFSGEPDAAFDRKTMHGSQRAGYAEGGWQFAINSIPVRYSTRTTFQWNGELITAKLLHA